MIRMYFSVSKCVKSIRSLKRTEKAIGVFPNLKNYSVSVTSEVESKPKNEAEEETVETPGEKNILSAAFAKLKDDKDSNKDSVKTSAAVKDSKEFSQKVVGGFKGDLEKLKTIFASHEKENVLYEKMKSVVATLEEMKEQKPPPPKDAAEQLQEKLVNYISSYNFRVKQKPARQPKFPQDKSSGYLRVLEQEVRNGKALSVSEIIIALKKMVESRSRPESFLKLLAAKLMTTDELDVKECSDILFCLASLHYREENLIAKLTENICLLMDSFNNASVLNCILRSYAMLSYRDPTILTLIIDWISKNKDSCKDQMISNAIMSLAVLNYFPDEAKNLVQEFSNELDLQNSTDTSTYLDNVWSLALLNSATHEQVSEVLAPGFGEKIKSSDGYQISFSKALKILNINGYATNILKDYKGPILTNNLKDIIPSTKYKSALIASVIDALLNLLPSTDYIVTNVNTRYGFVIDAEFFVDANGKPLPYVLKANRSGSKIAVLVLSYFDLCHGTEPAPTGTVALSQRILEARGYKVLTVPYTEFPPDRRLVDKLKFLEGKIKSLAAS